MPIEFSEAEKKKLLLLNPDLRSILFPVDVEYDEKTEKILLEAIERNTETWDRLEVAYRNKEEAYRDYIKVTTKRPLVTPIQIIGAFIFLFILVRIIGG